MFAGVKIASVVVSGTTLGADRVKINSGNL